MMKPRFAVSHAVCLLLLGVISCSVGKFAKAQSGLPEPTPNVEATPTPTPTPTPDWEYDSNNNDMSRGGGSVPKPYAPSKLQVSPGDRVGFRAEFVDGADRKRNKADSSATWQMIWDGEGPWEITLSVSGYGHWGSPTGPATDKRNGKRSGNAPLYIDSSWAAAGYPDITVTATITDKAPNHPDNAPAGTPVTHTRDGGASASWILTKRGSYVPKKEHCVSGPLGVETQMGGYGGVPFVHQADPNGESDDPPAGTPRPYYSGQLVDEDVAPATALFSDSDIDPAWRNASPERLLMTKNQIAEAYFGSNSNNSFVLGSAGDDQFQDDFGGTWVSSQKAVFTTVALQNGVSVQNLQKYKAAGRVLGSYTLKIKGKITQSVFANYVTRTQG